MNFNNHILNLIYCFLIYLGLVYPIKSYSYLVHYKIIEIIANYLLHISFSPEW